MNEYIRDYLKGGLYDHLQDPEEFAGFMSDRLWVLSDYYLAGITELELWYGDKAYRQYGDWFECLDSALRQAENIFGGRFGNE